MKRSVKLRKQMTGRAGESYDVFQILNRGARLTSPPGRQGVDVYVSDADDTRHIGIQVKTKEDLGFPRNREGFP